MNKAFAVLCAAGAALLLSGCISARSYVDSALPPADKTHVPAVERSQPVQALYEFRTRGVANAGATEQTRAAVMEVLQGSGVFSAVSAEPVAAGRRLIITIDNVPITSHEDAMAKGFGTGLTFGLIGTMVTDGYVCEATYSAPAAEPVKLSYRHAIHTTIGNASGPPGLEGRTPAEAANLLVRQLTWSVLRDLGKAGRL